MNKTECVQRFLKKYSKHPLKNIFREGLEAQVNVDPSGTKIERGYTDGLEVWNHFRLREIKPDPCMFNFIKRVYAIGFTGWDFNQCKSLWVGFDFDSIVGHKRGLSNNKLEQLIKRLADLPWVSIYRSTSGNGFHVYVILDPVTINNPKEHRQLALTTLNRISALTSYDFSTDVDVCGSILWVWHKHQGVNAYEVIKEGVEQLHILPTPPIPIKREWSNDSVELSPGHLRLLQWLEENGCSWWWDTERRLLICHTFNLKQAHRELKLNGRFDTISSGESGANAGKDHNCFAIPINDEGWLLRRFGIGTREHELWTVNESGYSQIYYNQFSTISESVQYNRGIETSTDVYSFKTAEQLQRAINDMGSDVVIPFVRGGTIKHNKRKGKLLITIPKEKNDADQRDWVDSGKNWKKTIAIKKVVRTRIPHDKIRHVIHNSMDSGWYCNTTHIWVKESRPNIRDVFISLGFDRSNIDFLMGKAISQHWTIINTPFQNEYPGKRRWNLNNAKYSVDPKLGPFPTFSRVLSHCGRSLTPLVKENEWCKLNNVNTGEQYLTLWLAWLFQKPEESLPYLFFYGPQNSGKSTFHETVSLLFKHQIGYIQADNALTNANGFNGELDGAVFCFIEETNLNQSKSRAYNRIKDWVTSSTIAIRDLYKTTYQVQNYTHWVQCGNSIDMCPIIPGDTRITAIYVHSLPSLIDKATLMEKLNKEKAAFLNHIITLTLPMKEGRLNIPIIETGEKEQQAEKELNDVERFINEQCHDVPGEKILFSDFYTKMISMGYTDLSKIMVGKMFPNRYPKAKWGGAAQIYIGNISFTPGVGGKRLERVGGRLK